MVSVICWSVHDSMKSMAKGLAEGSTDTSTHPPVAPWEAKAFVKRKGVQGRTQ